LCLVLIYAIQKLKHYFQAHTVRVISKANLKKYVITKPVLSDYLSRWYLQLQHFDIIFVQQKIVKRQVLADFLADHSIPAEWELMNCLMKMFLWLRFSHYGRFTLMVQHIEKVLELAWYSLPPKEICYHILFTLTKRCSNNVAEYHAHILSLELANDMK
jgi:hypothetical protein